ncbi:MAG: YegS/Rv2252/BmrU family lipid kinase [Caldilineaceae bacterium]
MDATQGTTAQFATVSALRAAQASHSAQLQQVEAAHDQLMAAHAELVRIERELARLAQRQSSAVAPILPPTPAPETASTTLILNPAAKVFLDGLHTPAAIVATLAAVGLPVQLATTTLEINAYQLAQRAVADGATLIIAAGGDGTIEEVAAALVDTGVALGILPLGTMNNIARALGIPLDLTDAATVLAMGAIRHIDVGHVLTPDQSIEGYFLETAGIGLSAIAAPMGEAVEKGRWADVFSKLGELLTGAATEVTVRCDDAEVIQAQTHTLTISNAPLFGNNMLIAPDAKIDDGLLDLALYADMELVDLTAYFFAISGGGRTTEPRIIRQRARRVQITTTTPLAVNADLDVLDEQQQWEIVIKARALAVVVGNGLGLTLPVTAAPAPPPPTGAQPTTT